MRKMNHYHPATGILKVASLRRYKSKCLREKRVLEAGLIDEIIAYTKERDFEHAIQVIQEYKISPQPEWFVTGMIPPRLLPPLVHVADSKRRGGPIKCPRCKSPLVNVSLPQHLLTCAIPVVPVNVRPHSKLPRKNETRGMSVGKCKLSDETYGMR